MTFQPPQPANSQAGVGATRGVLVQQLVPEADRRADEVVGAFEDVHLAAADHGDRARHDRHCAVVEHVLPDARARPDELVVVVAVGLADGVAVAADVEHVEQHHLHGVVPVREAIDSDAAAPFGGGRLGRVAQRAHARGFRGQATSVIVTPGRPGRELPYEALTAEMSSSSLTLSLTARLPLPRTWLNFMP